MEHFPLVLLFALFSPLWWLLIAAATISIIWSLDNERGGFATFTLVITALALFLFGDARLPAFVIAHPGSILLAVLGYFVGGAVWSVVKWSLFAQEKRDDYEDHKRRWLRGQGVTSNEVPEGMKQSFLDLLLDNHQFSNEAIETTVDEKGAKTVTRKRVVNIVPIAWDNKSRIMTWMMFWPWSATWALIDDFVRKAFKWAQRKLEALMDKIARYHFRDAHKDYTIVGKAPERKIEQPAVRGSNNGFSTGPNHWDK